MLKSTFAATALVMAAFLVVLPTTGEAGPVSGGAATVFDFNGDTKSDLLLNKVGAPNQGLLRTLLIDGASLVGSGFPAILPAGFSPSGAGDFDGNGQADILARKTTNPNQGILRILKLDAAGTAVSSNAFPTIVPAGFSLIGIGDLDANGKDDLAYVKLANPNAGLIRVFLFSDAGDFSIKSTGFPTFMPSGFNGIGLADMNGDGRADIVAQKQGAPNAGLVRVFLTGADGKSVTSSTFPAITPTGFGIAGIAPFDADTRADFLLEKASAPNAGLLRIQFVAAGATGISGSAFPTILPSALQIVGTGDYDGVNQTDISTRNLSTGLIRIFRLNAGATAVAGTGFPTAPPTSFEVVAVGPVIP